ncbi:hypothetical protein CTA1_809 [Colletotrichum tanaceti]|uniref:Uncharacterized protein n=1 Tax=Colletotrichum tanaceti TaxID=1306861 RepID=A0A4U6XF54_9PEZI|nr:hypothetical protein CTA1_809 [Colletotrichum tanaceti]
MKKRKAHLAGCMGYDPNLAAKQHQRDASPPSDVKASSYAVLLDDGNFFKDGQSSRILSF